MAKETRKQAKETCPYPRHMPRSTPHNKNGPSKEAKTNIIGGKKNDRKKILGKKIIGKIIGPS